MCVQHAELGVSMPALFPPPAPQLTWTWAAAHASALQVGTRPVERVGVHNAAGPASMRPQVYPQPASVRGSDGDGGQKAGTSRWGHAWKGIALKCGGSAGPPAPNWPLKHAARVVAVA